jgi:glycosyltransferase involved in cell wall biosynthesis
MAGVAAMMADVLANRGMKVANVHTTCASGDESVCAKVWRHVRKVADYARCLIGRGPAPVWIHTCSGFSFYHAGVHVLLAKWLRCPVILHIHGGRFMDFAASAGPLGRLCIRGMLQSSDAVVVVSQGWRRQIRQLAPQARTCVLENAINDVGCIALEQKTRSTVCRFGYLGRLDVEKGVLDLLHAARTLADRHVPFQLTLAGPIGTAGDPQAVATRAVDMGLSGVVRVIGPVEGAGKQRFFAECDAYLQPSHFEGLPLSLLEAMAHGLPAIATRVGAIPEVITHGADGMLIVAKDRAALAQAMLALADDGVLRARMGAAARDLVMRRFGIEGFAESVLQILRRTSTAGVSLNGRRAPVGGAC